MNPRLLVRGIALVSLAMLGIAGCSDNNDGGTVDDQKTVVNVFPAEQVDNDDGAQAHTDKPSDGKAVTECSVMNLKGEVGTVAHGGFQDISVRGIGCADGRKAILQTFQSFDGTKVATKVGAYTCGVLHEDGNYVVVRCTGGNGNAYRFTVDRDARPGKSVDARKRTVVHECGTFGFYYDVSARDVTCKKAAKVIETNASEWPGLKKGKTFETEGYACRIIYSEGGHHTIRCEQSNGSVRFSLAKRQSTQHPKKHAPAQIHPPNVVRACSPTDDFSGITARGIDCATVQNVLLKDASTLKDLKPGSSVTVGSNDAFSCTRIDKGSEIETFECTSEQGSFRASTDVPPPAPVTAPTSEAPAADDGADQGDGDTETPDPNADGADDSNASSY